MRWNKIAVKFSSGITIMYSDSHFPDAVHSIIPHSKLKHSIFIPDARSTFEKFFIKFQYKLHISAKQIDNR